jgi:hypothetical protein
MLGRGQSSIVKRVKSSDIVDFFPSRPLLLVFSTDQQHYLIVLFQTANSSSLPAQ